MYERGPHDWSNLSYGSGASYPAPSGSDTAQLPQVTYRSPSGEPAMAPPAAPLSELTELTPGAPTPTFEPEPMVDVTGAQTPPVLPIADPSLSYPMRNLAGRMAFVCGVAAIVCTTLLFPLYPIAIALAGFAIVLGRHGRRRARYGFASNGGSASAGVALGSVALLMAAALTALTAWLFSAYDVTAAKDCVVDSTSAAQAMHCIADVIDAG